ncbi:YaiI/YqxD family protein [Priestia megaterium]|uniref:YaiI/YqxD family protein n=1 Tax=Priestia megaterium TaxID=1404 RepID=UPI0030B9952D
MQSYSKRKSKVFVDADACPVKAEIVELTHTYDINLVFVASYAHMQTNPTPGKWVYVDAEKEAADLYILNHAVKQDIVVTQDTGLASMLVSRGVYALSPRGKYYNDDEMNTVLFFRYVSAKERRSGRHTKGPKAFSEEDRQHFIQAFEKMLSKLAGI